MTLFSDPMAGALTAITDKTHTGYYGNYIPIGSELAWLQYTMIVPSP